MVQLLPLMFALTACKKAPPDNATSIEAVAPALEGTWRDDGGMLATIENAEVTSLVDHDNEVFVVIRSGWEEQGFSIHYEVPSTQYLVTLRLTDIDDSVLQYRWSNTTPTGESNAGTGAFERVE
ncbi:MAG: hypothetical protein P8R54_26770 [Myxococcota bacterium]|nr:hypothetical protein [Myxococcota bacterium]